MVHSPSSWLVFAIHHLEERAWALWLVLVLGYWFVWIFVVFGAAVQGVEDTTVITETFVLAGVNVYSWTWIFCWAAAGLPGGFSGLKYHVLGRQRVDERRKRVGEAATADPPGAGKTTLELATVVVGVLSLVAVVLSFPRRSEWIVWSVRPIGEHLGLVSDATALAIFGIVGLTAASVCWFFQWILE